MAFDYTLLTSFLDDCNIQYEVENGVVNFNYDNRFFIGTVIPTPPFDATLAFCLPGILEVAPFDTKQYLKLINQLNFQSSVVKFVLSDKNVVYADVQVPLDSSPELDDLVPGLVRLLIDAHEQFKAAIQK